MARIRLDLTQREMPDPETIAAVKAAFAGERREGDRRQVPRSSPTGRRADDLDLEHMSRVELERALVS